MKQHWQGQSEKEFKRESEVFNSRAEKFKLIFNASPDMIFILSHQGLILDANESALAVYEYQHEDIFGKSYEKLLTKCTHIKNTRRLIESVNKGAEIDYEWMSQTRSGKEIPVDVRLRSLKVADDEQKSAIVLILRDISGKQKAAQAISSLARATNIRALDSFLEESARALSTLYGTKYAFIGRLMADERSIKTLVVLKEGKVIPNFIYSLDDTPCAKVIEKQAALISKNACGLYPKDELLLQMKVESYFGVSMIAENKKMGLVVLLDDQPLEVEEWAESILELFANRLAVEIERYEVTQKLKANQEHLEQLVQQRTQLIEEQSHIIKQNNIDLEEANKEMKSFCYSVSHDLRAPLRGISGFSDVILEDYEDKLDELGKEYLNRIKDSTTNMASLIDGMLQLSRVSHYQEEGKETINLSVLAEELMMSFLSVEKDRAVNVTIQENLEVEADRSLVIILLQNLLGNAWKYTSKINNAKIEFAQERIKDKNVFVIRDNGAGFDMTHAEILFEPFKRLHGESEFSGSGIGLATVKKIVDLHGGTIWGESLEQSGATFYFTL